MDKTDQLHRFILMQSNRTFVGGKNDCGLLAADWLLERSGQDVAQDFRGRYDCEESALNQMRRLGHKGLSETVHSLLGRAMDAPMLAQRGDIALIDSKLGVACGVVTAQGVLAQTYRGITMVPLSKIISAWSVD